jgi:hypothetical protein
LPGRGRNRCKARSGSISGTVYTVVCRQTVIFLGVQYTITVISSAARRLEFEKYRRMIKPPANVGCEEIDVIVRRSANKSI